MPTTYPITWDNTGEKKFETGNKKGVLYVMTDQGAYGDGVPWNGLTAVTLSNSGADETALWADDIKYASREYNFTTEYVGTGDFLKYIFSPRYRRSERSTVVIAHYMGKCKPWKPSYYYKYYRQYRSYLNKYLTAREKRELLLRPWLVFKSLVSAVCRVIFG